MPLVDYGLQHGSAPASFDTSFLPENGGVHTEPGTPVAAHAMSGHCHVCICAQLTA